ncbi:MAG TPA: DNA gyrase inhibitor YacG [Usitatibacter sp.]|nr:DNA gyrase inhibitor YacG [Usitatibacter sp.]
MACPACGKPSLFAPSNPWRPFCSERCKTTDLGAWASESYRIPAKPEEEGGHDPDQS